MWGTIFRAIEKYTCGGQVLKKLLIFLVSTTLIVSWGKAQSASALYQEANKVFQTYRYKVPYENFRLHTFQQGGKEVLELVIVINSRRNNFDEAMLVGFAASGAAITNTGTKVDLVNVVIKVQYKDEVSISAIADAPDVIALYENKLAPNAFLAEVIFH